MRIGDYLLGNLTTEPLPKIDTGLKSKYTFDNFVQGMEIFRQAGSALQFLKILQQHTTLSLSMVDRTWKDSPIERNWKSNPRKYSKCTG